MDRYYDEIAAGYDNLHKDEQEKKLKIIKGFIKPKASDILLDIGCGTGISSQFNCKTIGIDPSMELLKIAKHNFPEKMFIQAEAENLPLKDRSIQNIISLTAAQNFNSMQDAIDEMNRVRTGKAAISILKKSPKTIELKQLLKNAKMIEEDKDLIFIQN